MGDHVAVPGGAQPGRDRLDTIGVVEQVDLALAVEHLRDPLGRVAAVDADLGVAPAAAGGEQLDGALVGSSDVEVVLGICPHRHGGSIVAAIRHRRAAPIRSPLSEETCHGDVQPPRPDRDPRAAGRDRRLRGVPEDRRPLGAPADVPDMREDRLLRLIPQPARQPPCPRGRSSGLAVRRAGRGLVVVRRRRRDVRPGGEMSWPALPYEAWSATCDTLHAHTQVLGKLAATIAPPEPQLQHAALRLTARGWETLPLPAPDGSGAFVVALDLHEHAAVAEHSDGRSRRVALVPDRPVGAVTGDVLTAVGDLVGAVAIDPTPQEVPWTVPLDQDDEHATYQREQVATYFAAATRAA